MCSVAFEGCDDEGEVSLLLLDLLVCERHEVPREFGFRAFGVATPTRHGMTGSARSYDDL